jgi:hypothetical protein
MGSVGRSTATTSNLTNWAVFSGEAGHGEFLWKLGGQASRYLPTAITTSWFKKGDPSF